MLCRPALAADIDWDAAYRETRAHLINLINIKTAQPEGSEVAAARYIYCALNREGIDWEIYKSASGRANLVARLKGSGNGKPLLLMAHLDTVGADAAEWASDPFRAAERGGAIYGRGAVDCKSLAAINLSTLVWLKRSGIKLRRDVIMLASADEEAGGALGLRWMLDKHPGAIDCGFALNEGGGMILGADGSPRALYVDVGAKPCMKVVVSASGRPGHPAMPPRGQAIYSLSAALNRLKSGYRPQTRMTPLVRRLFEGIYPFQNQDGKTTLDMLFSEDPAARRQAEDAIALDPFLDSQLRDTCSPVILRAGDDGNVIPGHARAELDCRLLPDSDPEAALSELKAAVGDAAEVSVKESPEKPFPKPMDMTDELYETIVRVSSAAMPTAVLAGGALSPASDSEWLRRRGIITYGLCGPSTYGESSGVHGADERISEAELRQQLKLIYLVTAAFAGEAAPPQPPVPPPAAAR
ncbi:MAG: M20/M25/M40 family metallo-hydrolase [Elusimicrobiales bacterium]